MLTQSSAWLYLRKRRREANDPDLLSAHRSTRLRLAAAGVVGYGYRWDRNSRSPVPHPEEFAVVQALFAEALDLSTRKLGPKYGLRPDHVLRILRNPVYTGWPARHCHKVRWKGGTGSTG